MLFWLHAPRSCNVQKQNRFLNISPRIRSLDSHTLHCCSIFTCVFITLSSVLRWFFARRSRVTSSFCFLRQRLSYIRAHKIRLNHCRYIVTHLETTLHRSSSTHLSQLFQAAELERHSSQPSNIIVILRIWSTNYSRPCFATIFFQLLKFLFSFCTQSFFFFLPSFENFIT